MTNHDDLMHPVPPIAYLRWKENYFFIVMAAESGVFGVCHFNNEPGFGRSRFTCNLSVKGKRYSYTNEHPFPDNFDGASELSDGRLTMRIVKSHSEFTITLNGDDFGADLTFQGRLPTFDFRACRYAAPEVPSFQEVMTFATNLPFEHLQQSMTVSGEVRLRDGTRTPVEGLGYRDHSWGMRCDNAAAWHTWSGLNFPGRSLGIMTFESLQRPGLICKEGYVVDRDGTRALRSISVETSERAAGSLPSLVTFKVTDVHGTCFLIEADVAKRLGQVALVPESAVGPDAYTLTENFCPIRDINSGDTGIALVELGYSPIWERRQA